MAHMDMEYVSAQMIYLCIQPRKVYQLTAYRKQTKNQWARDDPAFVVTLVLFQLATSIAYGVALQVSFGTILRMMMAFAGLQFALFGALFATIGWHVSNTYMRVQSVHGTEQLTEWLFCFDIHCNSFFPFFLITYVLQFFLLPLILQSGFFASFLSNLIYFFGVSYYCYLTSLGYATLPFLTKSEIFLYPALSYAVLAVFFVLGQVNPTHLWLYFTGV